MILTITEVFLAQAQRGLRASVAEPLSTVWQCRSLSSEAVKTPAALSETAAAVSAALFDPVASDPGIQMAVDDLVQQMKDSSLSTEDVVVKAVGLGPALERQQQVHLSMMLAKHKRSFREQSKPGGRFSNMLISDAIRKSVEGAS